MERPGSNFVLLETFLEQHPHAHPSLTAVTSHHTVLASFCSSPPLDRVLLDGRAEVRCMCVPSTQPRGANREAAWENVQWLTRTARQLGVLGRRHPGHLPKKTGTSSSPHTPLSCFLFYKMGSYCIYSLLTCFGVFFTHIIREENLPTPWHFFLKCD